MNKSDQLDMTLDIDMAYLDLDGKEEVLGETGPQQTSETLIELVECEIGKQPRRSKRKKIRSIDCENRRTSAKPKKFIDANKETANYYLDKRVKKLPSTLETIFEEPTSGVFMSNRRQKRCINFPEVGIYYKDKVKVKKRILKAKKINPKKKWKKRISMDLLMKKLMSIEQAN